MQLIHLIQFIRSSRSIFFSFLLSAMICIAPTSWAVQNDTKAPDFTLMGSDGKDYSLSQFKGKIVVLEWLNYGCPFVQKHYNAKFSNMQNLQKKYTANPDVIWLSIISSAEGKEGYSTPKEALENTKKYGAHPTAVLLDKSGKVGKLYGAKTTPHIFIIGKEGKLLYQGAIDNKPSANVDDIPKAKNYIASALDHIRNPKLKGKPLETATSNAYGCSVKY